MEENLTAADWVTAIAAGVQAFAALAIVALTVVYVRATNKISAANDRMADANDRVLEEMRVDREHFRHERSVDAAARLTAALATTVRNWREARDDTDLARYGALRGRADRAHGYSADEKRWRIYQDWLTTHLIERGAIQPAALVTDVDRFTGVLRIASGEWDTILAMIADEEGEDVSVQRRNADNRSYRLTLCSDKLMESLEAHRRGDAVEVSVLPADAWDFLMRSPGTAEAALDDAE